MKHKKLVIVLIVIVALMIGGCSYLFLQPKVTDAASAVTAGDENTNSLIVYFSRSGVITTKKGVDANSSASLNTSDSVTGQAAKQLQRITGSDLFEIKTKRRYPNAYRGSSAAALIQEVLNLRPALAAYPQSIDKYDVIYVGYPLWWFNAPMAIGTFLEHYHLKGKTVVPFCTSTSNSITRSEKYIRKVSGKARVLKGYRFNQSSDDDVKAWLKGIGMYK